MGYFELGEEDRTLLLVFSEVGWFAEPITTRAMVVAFFLLLLELLLVFS